MKGHTGHKEHHHRERRNTGGANEAEEDLKTKNMRYTAHSNVNDEAEERKHGGRLKRRHGGEVHHSSCKCHKCMGGEAKKHGGEAKKHVGHVEGEHAKKHGGRMPRKAGGRAGADMHPYSTAAKSTPAPGRKLDEEMQP